MKSKKGLVIIASIILFMAVLLLGANTVFSVTEIEINATSEKLSTQADLDLKTLYNALNKEYLGDNILFIREEKVVSYFDAYPYLQVKAFKKSYPSKLELSVEEKTERYALKAEKNGEAVYYMADAQGEILRESKENVNNVDGGENFLIEGLRYSVESKFLGDGNLATVLTACVKMEELTGGIRTCLKSITVKVDATGTEFIIYTYEGVTIRIDAPAEKTEEKVEKAINFYLNLSTEDKLFGEIFVFERLDQAGEVGITHTPRV